MFNKYTELLHRKYPIKGETWFKVGGPLDILFEPDSVNDLVDVLREVEGGITVLGACSNVLIRDGGVNGFCIRLGKIKAIEDVGEKIFVGAGSSNARLVSFAKSRALSGFEFLSGIPGTVGAGVKMNAGCFGKEYKDIVENVEIVSAGGARTVLGLDEIGFSYRQSLIPDNAVITKVIFKKTAGLRSKIEQSILEILEKKTGSQPAGLTCGCAFKNGKSYSAGQLIDECGLKGHKINGAFVSEKHANFVMNDGTATASDIESLFDFIKTAVYEKFGVSLELEIKVIGER